MKIKLDKTDSKVIHSNETYDVIDNTDLNNLIVSKTILHEGKETSGHNHKGQEEVYIFRIFRKIFFYFSHFFNSSTNSLTPIDFSYG